MKMGRFGTSLRIAVVGMLAITAGVCRAQDNLDGAVLSAADVRAKLQQLNARIAAKPNDAQAYVDMSEVLLDAGVGNEARAMARRGVELDPDDSISWYYLAGALRANLIGKVFGVGMDYDGAVAAYRKALAFDPKDQDARRELADTLEFNRDGLRYTNPQQLAEAIDLLKKLRLDERPAQDTTEENLMIDLFYAGRYQEAFDEAAGQLASPTRDGVMLAADAGWKGATEAIALADGMKENPARRREALDYAAQGLCAARKYKEAAALLMAGIPVQENDQKRMAKIQILRDLKPYDESTIVAGTPRAPVEHLMAKLIAGRLNLETMSMLMIRREGMSDQQREQEVDAIRGSAGMVQSLSEQTGLPPVVLQDVVMGLLKFNVATGEGAGNGERGYRVTAQLAGSVKLGFFVVKEKDHYRIAAIQNSDDGISRMALRWVEQDRLGEATSMLDWKRSSMEKSVGEDPLAGSLFARLWTVGGGQSKAEVEAAAVALGLSQVVDAAGMVRLATLRDSTTNVERRTALDQVIAVAAARSGDVARAKTEAALLLKEYPDSATAVRLMGAAYRLDKDWPAWDALLAERLRKHPADSALLRQKVVEQEAEGQFAEARKTLRSVIAGEQAVARDENEFAWLSLFEKQTDADAVAAAKRAALSTKYASFAELETLGCLYAAEGKTVEARQTLLQAMAAAHLVEPNDAVWLGFGMIYEQYGSRSAARAAFERVRQPAGVVGPVDVYVLAKRRLQQLNESEAGKFRAP